MIAQVLSATSTVALPSLSAKFGFEVILRIINQPQNYVGTILGLSVVFVVLPLTGLCYLIKKLYNKHFPEEI